MNKSDGRARKNLLLLSTTATGGKTTVALGLIRLLADAGVQAAYFKPVAQRMRYPSDRPRDRDKKISATVFSELASMSPVESLSLDESKGYFSEGHGDYFAERVVELYHTIAPQAEVVVVEGMQYDDEASTLAFEVNTKLALSLTADVILVVDAHQRSRDAISDVEAIISAYREENVTIAGLILNKMEAAPDGSITLPPDIASLISEHGLRLLGIVPFVRKLSAPRVRDLVEPLNARVLRGAEQISRRALHPTILAMGASNAVKTLKGGDLIIVPGDRNDIIMMAHLFHRSLETPELAGLVLTVGYEPSPDIMELIDHQGGEPLPILLVETDTYETSRIIQQKRVYIEDDDLEKVRWTVQLIVENLDRVALLELLELPVRDIVSPAQFRYSIIQRARRLQKRIVLPEGDEPRTLQAAAIVLERGIAELVLLGDPQEIHEAARKVNARIDGAEIIDPANSDLFDRYVEQYVELRRHKGMNRPTAVDLMHDRVYFGTMMLLDGRVDGLVSGAVHTTQHTILPAFQVIKTRPNVDLVSSVFFMLLADQVWVFGDCAVVPDPTAPQLAQIALQASDTARAFGIDPRVAMISYSTGTSGVGVEVEKVRAATKLVRDAAPTLLIDGPLQFDAASTPDVAAKKAAGSPVAGRANVFIFPDLNTGNTTYKAVQRSGDYISIGPVLQGLRRPVNDLSRGALVDDIVYTIAVTAIQAETV